MVQQRKPYLHSQALKELEFAPRLYEAAKQAYADSGLTDIEAALEGLRRVIELHKLEVEERLELRRAGKRCERPWEVPPGTYQRAITNMNKLRKERAELIAHVEKNFNDAYNGLIQDCVRLVRDNAFYLREQWADSPEARPDGLKDVPTWEELQEAKAAAAVTGQEPAPNAQRPEKKPGAASGHGEPQNETASAPSSQEDLPEAAQATPSGGR